MRSTFHHLAQARIALLTLGDAPHGTLLASHAAALDAQRAGALETEKLARIHPAAVLKEAAVGGFSALSLLSVLVFGRSFATAYIALRRQIGDIEVPFFDVGGQLERLLPSTPVLEQASRLPEISWEQAVYGAIGVAAVIILFHAVKAVFLLRRERLLAHSAQDLAEAAGLLREAGGTRSREDALAHLSRAMDTHARTKNHPA